MKYQESATVELKRLLEDDMKTEIIAFLNSYLGGVIYVGINDDGTIFEQSWKEKDEIESKVINWIRDEVIYPNCSDFVTVSFNEDEVLKIEIASGNQKPYYLKNKGPKPSGVYVRYGRNKSQASQEEITRMIRESNNESFETLISKVQDLSFDTLQRKFKESNFDFGDFKMITSGFKDAKTNLYTNLAFWFSDQYHVETKMAVYQGEDRSVFRSKKEFTGSILKQIDQAIEYFDLCNEIRIIIDGSPTRKEIPSYSMLAAREGILNCFCHRDYSRKSNIKIEFFDDRCEIISPGGFYDGLTLQDALSGIQSFRNENLVKLLFRLGYIENYASGLSRIFSEYRQYQIEPKIETSNVALKLILPNRNYEAFFVNKNHIVSDVDASELSYMRNQTNSSEANRNLVLIFTTIQRNPGIKRKELSELLNKSESTVSRYLKVLLEKGLIKRDGAKKTGGYVVIHGN